ncbi:MAG: YihY/virulence factor BrkB family protein [Phycisphaerae bacterium]
MLRQTVSDWVDDRAASMSAAIAFYTVFSLAPLTMLALGVASLVLGERAGSHALRSQLSFYVGRDAARFISEAIYTSAQAGHGVTESIVGLVALFFGATAVFSEIQSALNAVWKTPPRRLRPVHHLLGYLLRKCRAVGMTLIFGAAMLASFLLGAAWGVARKEIALGGLFLGRAYHFLVALVLLLGLLMTAYKVLPEARIRWRDVWMGAAITAVAMMIGEVLIGLYLARAQVGTAYGAAGSLVLVLVWVYYSAMVFLFGAEFTHVYAKRRDGGTDTSAALSPAGVQPGPAARRAGES